MFKYKIYNQNILSDISLDSLKLSCSKYSKHDIRIISSGVLNTANIPKKKYKITPKGGFFYEPKVGLFTIDSTQISVMKNSGADESRIAETLMNFPLAFSLSLKKFLVVHASAIKYDNTSYMFVGKSHSGKSTLASYFLSLGATLIAEDILFIALS